MKQKDLAMVFIIAVISGVLSIILSGIFLTPPEKRQQAVEVVQPLNSAFERPDKDYFNDNSNNPTQTIRIGEDPNQEPFNALPAEE